MNDRQLRKKTFIEDITNSNAIKTAYEIVFDKVEYLEKRFNKDLKDFDNKEMREVIRVLSSNSIVAEKIKMKLCMKYRKYYS